MAILSLPLIHEGQLCPPFMSFKEQTLFRYISSKFSITVQNEIKKS